MNLDGLTFKLINSSGQTDLSETVLFRYFQQGICVWGTYRSNEVENGTLFGTMTSTDEFEFTYCHRSQGHIRRGHCSSKIQIQMGWPIQIHETWAWTDGKKGTGTSIIEEVFE